MANHVVRRCLVGGEIGWSQGRDGGSVPARHDGDLRAVRRDHRHVYVQRLSRTLYAPDDERLAAEFSHVLSRNRRDPPRAGMIAGTRLSLIIVRPSIPRSPIIHVVLTPFAL